MMTVNLKRHLTALVLVLLPLGPGWTAEAEMPQLLEDLRTATEADAAKAERALRRAWSKSGSAAMDLLLTRGREAMEEGNHQLAIEHFTALTDHAPDFAEGFHSRAMAYHAAGLYGPAIDDLARVLTLNPDHYNAIFGLAAMYHEFGDLRRAARLYRKVLTIHPHHEDAKKGLATLRRDGIGRTL